MTIVLILYAAVAVLTSLFIVSLRREWMLELFTADLILSSVGAWVGGMMFGAFGPVVAGISIIACFAMALPLVYLFNAFLAPAVLNASVPGEITDTPTLQLQPVGPESGLTAAASTEPKAPLAPASMSSITPPQHTEAA